MRLILQNIPEDEHSLERLEQLVHYLRRGGRNLARYRVQELIHLLETDAVLRENLITYLRRVLLHRDAVDAFCESGILPGSGFFQELYRKMVRKVLPEVYPQEDLRFVLATCFFRKNDYKWVSAVPVELWNTLWKLLPVLPASRAEWGRQVVNALVVLSHRITSLGLEPELSSKLPDIDKLDSPFITQSAEIIAFARRMESEDFRVTADDTDYRHIGVLLGQCEGILNHLRSRRNDFGASIALTYILVRLRQHIHRVQLLLQLLCTDPRVAGDAFNRIWGAMIRAENTRNSVLFYINQNADLIAYQVTEHASKTGEHYITSTPREYFQLFRQSLQGGVIVGFMALFKVLIYYLRFAPFGQALLYSLNYATGFVGMQLTHSALATKQPALTAQKLASSLDTKTKNSPDPLQVADMVARVSRSQFISFVGNLLVVFPMGMLVAWVYQIVLGYPLATHAKAEHLIHEIHPLRSGSILFASVAGFYLFLSGIVSGYFDNLVIYQSIPARIAAHPLLRRILPHGLRHRFSTYVEHNLGGLAGNVFFGLCMGSTPILGHFFGIGIDVRHITFAAANLGIALVSLDFTVALPHILWALAGIVLIGAFNFMVSFVLAFYVAIKARGISIREYPVLVREVAGSFLRHPRRFFFP